MGECGCNALDILKALTINKKKTIGLSIYPGCKECAPLIGITLFCFDKDGYKEWIRDSCDDIEKVHFDEYGGNEGFGWRIPIIDASKFIEALEGMREMYACDFNQYACIEDFLEDWGLTLMQETLRRTIEDWQKIGQENESKRSN